MTDGATMPAFSDERLIDAAGAVVADRPEQRPVLVVAAASRLEVVVDAPPYPSHGAFCRSRAPDREHQAVSALAQPPVVMLVTISWRFVCFSAPTEADGSAPCKGEHVHDDRCSDRH